MILRNSQVVPNFPTISQAIYYFCFFKKFTSESALFFFSLIKGTYKDMTLTNGSASKELPS